MTAQSYGAPRAVSGCGLDDPRVECLVDVEHMTRIDVPPARNCVELGVDSGEFVGQRSALSARQRHDLGACKDLQVTNDPIELARVVARQRCNDDVRIPFAGVLDRVPFAA